MERKANNVNYYYKYDSTFKHFTIVIFLTVPCITFSFPYLKFILKTKPTFLPLQYVQHSCTQLLPFGHYLICISQENRIRFY